MTSLIPAVVAYRQAFADLRAKMSAASSARSALDTAIRDQATKYARMKNAVALQANLVAASDMLTTLGEQHDAAEVKAALAKKKFPEVALGEDESAAYEATLAAAGEEIDAEEIQASTTREANKIQQELIAKSEIEGEVNADNPFAFTQSFIAKVAANTVDALNAEVAARAELNHRKLDSVRADEALAAAKARVEPAARAAYKEQHGSDAPMPSKPGQSAA